MNPHPDPLPLVKGEGNGARGPDLGPEKDSG